MSEMPDGNTHAGTHRGIWGSTVNSSVLPSKTAREFHLRDSESVSENRISKYSRKRWVILFVFSVANLLVALNGMLYPPIELNVAKLWGVSVNDVNLIAQLSMVLPLVFYFYAMYFADRHPIEHAFYISFLANMLGSVIRTALPTAGSTGYYTALICQVMISVAHPFLGVLPARISTKFFPADQRTLATSVAILAQLLGIGSGMMLSPNFGNNIDMIYMIHTIASGITLVLALFLFDIRMLLPRNWGAEKEPGYKARSSSSEQIASPNVGLKAFCSTLARLSKNGAFVRLLIAGPLSIATVQVWISTLQINAPSSFDSPDAIMLIAGLFFGFGVMGTIITSYFVDKYRDPIKIARITLTASWVACAATMIGWYLNKRFAVFIGIPLTAVFGFGLVGITIELGIEYAYRENERVEATVNGIYMVLTNLFTSLLITCSTPGNIFVGATARDIPLFWLGLFTISLVLYWSLPKRYLRMLAEQAAADKKAAEIFGDSPDSEDLEIFSASSSDSSEDAKVQARPEMMLDSDLEMAA